MRAPSPALLRLLPALALAAIALTFSAHARADDLTVDLYTIGAGNYLYAAHGHSALCVTGGPRPEGRCYDFGVPDVEGNLNMVWRTLRGEPRFVLLAVDQRTLVWAFRWQERSIEKQRLPFTQAEAQALYDTLEAGVAARERYAYHPSTANCTTKVRDAIDAATGGKLRLVSPASEVPRYREILESGFRGQVLPLAGIALFSGTPIERPPSAWEHLFLPSRLRDAVEERFGAKPEIVYERRGATLAVNTLAGRALWIVVGMGLAALVWRARRARSALARELRLVGFVLGILGLAVHASAILFVYPELSHNWVLGVLWPTDLGLRWMRGAWLERYLALRVVVVAALGALSLAGVVVQPIASVAALAGLPLLALLLAVRARSPLSAPQASPG